MTKFKWDEVRRASLPSISIRDEDRSRKSRAARRRTDTKKARQPSPDEYELQIIGETEKSYRVRDQANQTHCLPKSQVRIRGGRVRMSVPSWLAKNQNLKRRGSR